MRGLSLTIHFCAVGWSLGGFLSLTMARMLAEDPSSKLSIAGFLIIDSPHHIARSKLAVPTSDTELVGIPDLVQKSFDNCDIMLEHWDLPSWDGPACGGREVTIGVAGSRFALEPGSVLYKPVDGVWKPIPVREYKHEHPVDEPRAPPPGVMIRCTRPTEKPKGATDVCLIDLHRHETLLGWEGRHADFIKAVIDVDADHYNVFDKYDQIKVRIKPTLSFGPEIHVLTT